LMTACASALRAASLHSRSRGISTLTNLSGLGLAAHRGPGEQHQGGEVKQGHRGNGDSLAHSQQPTGAL
jgi:hypothetical protein